MKKSTLPLIGLVLTAFALNGQNYLTPSEGHKAFLVFPAYSSLGAFDLDEHLLYANDGDTVHRLNLNSGKSEKEFGVPEGYTHAYPSFITIAPDKRTIWAGFTVFGNNDDRIYSVDVDSGIWKLRATLPGNFDLEFWNDMILVSGLNSTDWTTPGSVFLLDTSGLDQHRKVIEVGGYAAGFAVDSNGNLYFGTSHSQDPNAIYRWDSLQMAALLGTAGASPLAIGDGEKITGLPGGATDCEIDRAGNLIFTLNDIDSDKVLAKWNGIAGEGLNYDTLAVAREPGEWLGMVKSQGDIFAPSDGNRIITNSIGRPLVEVHRNYLPALIKPLPLFSGLETDRTESIRLANYFTDPDDEDDFMYKVVVNSDPSVAEVDIAEGKLNVNFTAAGQTNVVIEASNAGNDIYEKTVVGVQPVIQEETLLSDFENLGLGHDSYWNGSDGSGGFSTGDIHFYNEYNPDWFSWSGWAYSNVSDNMTPGFKNQYSAVTGTGISKDPIVGDTYGVGYVFGSPVLDFADHEAHKVAGFFVTNTTFAALSMEQGDEFSKKFGGNGGIDPDYFKLLIWGHSQGFSTDTVEYYLADYRFENDTLDYLIKTWQWVDLSVLGEVDSLLFGLESTDMGDWGMNTPAFFCIDDMHVFPNKDPVGFNSKTDAPGFNLKVYPNPSKGGFIISTSFKDAVSIKAFNLTGSLLFELPYYSPGDVIDMSAYPAGSYLIRVTINQGSFSRIIQKI